MSDNETNLLKWTAFAATNGPEVVGHMLNNQAREIARLRSVCREAATELSRSSMYHVVNTVIETLEQAGKEATDGQ